MRDPEASAMLPNLAAGLISILFAITIDSLDLNSSKDLNLEILHRSEPIIAVPPPTIPKRKSGNHHVNILKYCFIFCLLFLIYYL